MPALLSKIKRPPKALAALVEWSKSDHVKPIEFPRIDSYVNRLQHFDLERGLKTFDIIGLINEVELRVAGSEPANVDQWNDAPVLAPIQQRDSAQLQGLEPREAELETTRASCLQVSGPPLAAAHGSMPAPPAPTMLANIAQSTRRQKMSIYQDQLVGSHTLQDLPPPPPAVLQNVTNLPPSARASNRRVRKEALQPERR
ncbi:hypothetical protein BDW02DRAFT_115249 [Decorospora gaudefroyi]|uniref:Uncharacterized protein n=1 Tax=Decorospora gaudefroyi TaxID=184978 RepID=A0A6A5JYT3_9PLEO|nr:hypothetical protein BDW02DRAFT_115249 [Decorospora gaudefroyi]